MAGDKKHILSTRPLPKAIVEEGAQRNVIITEFSFISTKPVQSHELAETIRKLAAERHTVVFTSMNAVEAVAAQADAVARWRIYSIGNTTRELIEKRWGVDKLMATAENAQGLGERLVDDGVKELVFFCGNIRRDELPNKVRSEGGKVKEVVVYETEETPVKLAGHYDGILFFSPSAVHSFYGQNAPAESTVLFAIGKTTEEALRQHRAKKIIVANAADKTGMARQAIEYMAKIAG